MKTSNPTDSVASYYNNRWPIFEKWWCANETLGLHFAFYEKGIHNFKDAIYNMNDLIGRLLGLNVNKSMEILDAGCGVGGTSIYLGKKFPKAQFSGITVSSGQLQLAQRFIKERKAKNVEILLANYKKTPFPNDYFDGIFALESVCYTDNIQDFIDESYRTLKPGGMLIVIDGFQEDIAINPIIQKFYETYLTGRGISKRNIPYLKNYRDYLEKKGFTEIFVKDISKNVARSQIRSTIIGLPFFLSSTLKRILTLGKYNPLTNFYEFSMGVSVLATIVALNNVSKYYVTKAIKK